MLGRTRKGAFLIVVMVALGSGACGGQGSKTTAATVPATLPYLGPTTTLNKAPATPEDYAFDACLNFNSLDGYLQGTPEAGGDVAGQVQGMLQPVTVAVTKSGGGAQWVKLQTDMERLMAFASSKQWPTGAAATATPQVEAVVADCKAVFADR